MDRKQGISAPSEESLRSIEHISDRSELTTIYPRAKKEWEDTEIVSRDEREKRRTDEQLRISLSLRKWFLVIGLLTPLPFVIMGVLVAVATEYFDLGTIGFMALPIMIITGGIIFASYRAFRYAYSLFYKHGTWGVMFLTALFGLLGLSLNAIFLLTEPLHVGNPALDSLIIGGGVLVISVLYTSILVVIWTSPRINAKAKLALVGGFMVAILTITTLLHFI